jgi:hypothetical protein
LQVTPTPLSSRSLSALRPPEYYNNAKYEDIILKPICSSYNGSPEELVPFLNCHDI